ncbi:hypothetical protein ACU5B6_08590 [Moritella viscosa]|uniref:hypothetical protein n=1 Tax=Moritella viscosa TaxID=80854 RepID=UPI000924635F|nr:hypothetical protein [Moritella viscosa]SHO17325.1 Putative uncharacterized protein [Moritella viscosa]
MQTVQSVINEIMFIAMSRPDAIDITVEYHGMSDSIFIHVIRSNINVGRMTTQGLNDAVLFNKYIRLDEKACLLDDSKKTPLEAVLNAKRKIQALMVMPVSTEVAA